MALFLSEQNRRYVHALSEKIELLIGFAWHDFRKTRPAQVRAYS